MSIFVLDIAYVPWRAWTAARISNREQRSGLRDSRDGACFWLMALKK